MRCRDDRDKPFSETTWGVLLSQSAAILMIPDDALIEPDARYRRILVPLDGSARAETVLPVAVKLARAQNAELVLCYVLPDPGLTEVGTKDPETERLHALVRQRNEKTGKAYLDRIKKRLEYNGLKISIRISQGGDARRALIDVIAKEGADFVVMATHGQSGHRDVPIGDVARFIFDKATVPVLLVRYRNGRDANHAFGKVSSTGVRQPAGTD
jgi:nucleotide-binding universal stress UspA family protein